MPEEPSANPAPKPSNPTQVREPDNTRPPAEPTPSKPMKPQEAQEEPENEGM